MDGRDLIEFSSTNGDSGDYHFGARSSGLSRRGIGNSARTEICTW